MDGLNRLMPRGSKRTLMMMGAIVWMFAGYQIMRLGYQVVVASKNNQVISVVVALGVFYVFFNFIFKKMAKKHQIRIMSYAKEQLCLFSFFDKKGYIIMAIMMSGGMLIRSIEAINPMCWAPFYMGLGTALFLGGCLFMISWIRFNKIYQL
ncbi:MAG: hypothetical protein ACRCW2_12345 [Cellulosilyticaceae bacterium]